MKLSIVIPVYDEETTIRQVLEKLTSISFPFETEIIITDDGSTDRTSQIINEFNRKDILKVHTSLINLGKGAAVRFGLEYVEGDYVVIQDADLELNPEDIIKLVEKLTEEEVDVVYGSRFKSGMVRKVPVPWYTILANRILTSYTNLLYKSRLTDMATAYKLLKTDIVRRIDLKCIGFEFDPEITAKALRLGYNIEEVPISYQPRSIEEGKKISWKDAFKFIYYLTKYRFVNMDSIRSKKSASSFTRRPGTTV